MIKVKYDGKYPNTCSGTLEVIVDSVIVYKNRYCCKSTGCVYVDREYNSHVENGELIFNDEEAMKQSWYTEEIAEAIAWELSKFSVCCGGCI